MLQNYGTTFNFGTTKSYTLDKQWNRYCFGLQKFMETESMEPTGLFKGFINEDGSKVVYFNDRELDPRFDIFNLTRDGFDWGYNGTAPMQLSVAMLAQATSVKNAKRYKTQFMHEKLVKLAQNRWNMPLSEISAWLKQKYLEENPVNVLAQWMKETNLTKKELSLILEQPIAVIESWGFQNEIPPLAKRTLHYYKLSEQSQSVLRQLKSFLAQRLVKNSKQTNGEIENLNKNVI